MLKSNNREHDFLENDSYNFDYIFVIYTEHLPR
jgi:hypothetical protein